MKIRYTLLTFAVWTLAVMVVTTANSPTQSDPISARVDIQDEIEKLQVIQELNEGQWNSKKAAVAGEDDSENPISHRSERRSISPNAKL
jgi:hypothetical protein